MKKEPEDLNWQAEDICHQVGDCLEEDVKHCRGTGSVSWQHTDFKKYYPKLKFASNTEVSTIKGETILPQILNILLTQFTSPFPVEKKYLPSVPPRQSDSSLF